MVNACAHLVRGSCSAFARCLSVRSNISKCQHDHSEFFTWRPRTHRSVECDERTQLLVLFHVKQERLSTASDRKPRRWNIPGGKHDMFVGRGALKLPECCCPVTCLLRLLRPAQKASHREREDRGAAV